MEMKDGLPSYVKVQMPANPTLKLEQFLLCTSCTISYIFGDYNKTTLSATVKTEKMAFKAKGGVEIPVNFVETTLQMVADDKDSTEYNFTMDIGWISVEYQNSVYFDNFKENMLGLAPMFIEGKDAAFDT